MNDPLTLSDWQVAADAAKGALALEGARQYGLVTGGPKVHVERCVAILRRARKLGINPRPDAVERFAVELLKGGRHGQSINPTAAG